MKKFYDNYNSLVIPEETENINEIIADFYRGDIKYSLFEEEEEEQEWLNVHQSSVLVDTGKIIEPAINWDYNRMEQLLENVYAYVVPNGTETVNYSYIENDSCVKKLFIPASVKSVIISNWNDAPKKITDNVWVEVVPENPYIYSKDGSVYIKGSDEVFYLYQKPVEPPQKYERIKIRNLNGTSVNKCNCTGGWLSHWQNFSSTFSYLPEQCPCCHKKVSKNDLVGAHVQKENDNLWYIIPLCKECNSKTSDEIFEVDDIGFAWANKEETCWKYRDRYEFLRDFLKLNK